MSHLRNKLLGRLWRRAQEDSPGAARHDGPISVNHPDAHAAAFGNCTVCWRQSFDWPSDGGDPLRPCHQIDETRRDGPPSFVDIALMPSTTALSLKVFLRSNHNEMPNLIIPDSETDDLIAYILTLKQSFAPSRR